MISGLLDVGTGQDRSMNKSQKLDHLVCELEMVLARLPDDPRPDLQLLRDRVDDTVFEAWIAISRQERAPSAVAEFAESLDAVVRSRPWLFVCAAALLAGAAGYALAPSPRRPTA
jgi:ElaB/YqjD/DUF883 family membrane-anchored ribosome-binding protein